MPDPAPPTPIEPRDDLPDRLDALGRALAARESAAAPNALVAAISARRTRPIALRLGLLAAAAALLLGITFYAITRQTPAPSPTPTPIVNYPAPAPTPSIARSTTDHQSPTLATLRKLNPDPASDSLFLPTIATTSAASPPARPSDARDPSALARIAGPAR